MTTPPQASPSYRSTLSFICWFAFAAVLLALTTFVRYASGYSEYRSTLVATTANFWNLDQWQHCWLVLPISGFLVWRKRQELAALPIQGSWMGLPFLLGSLALFWIGYRVDNYFIGIGSVYILVAALIIWLFGWRWMKSLAFPWAFLFFALPLLFLESGLAFRLRLIMSDASVFLLNATGVHTVQQGTAILSAPDVLIGVPQGAQFSVDVADPCSGIRSLFALTMVTALYSYFSIKPFWKQLLLFACAVPLAVVGNMARIMMLTIGTIAVGPKIAIGSLEHPSLFHQFAGYLVFIVALGGMIGLGQLITLDVPSAISSLRARISAAFTPHPRPPVIAAATADGQSSGLEDEY